MIHGTRITTYCIAIFFSLSLAANAGEVTGLIKFKNETRADANEVNANFNAVKTAVDDNNQKIIALSEPRSASVTYSAMGFTPVRSEVEKIALIDEGTNVVENYKTEFEKNGADGSLIALGNDGGVFYHSVTLRSGVKITGIRARVSGNVTVNLKKEKEGNINPLATVTATGGGVQNIEYGNIDHDIEEFPASYFIEVLLSNSEQHLYSVAIEYTYTEP